MAKMLTSRAGVSFSPRKDVIGTTKLVAGTLLVVGLQSAVFVLIGWRSGWQWGVAGALMLLVSGYGCVKVFDRFGSLTRLSVQAVRSMLLGERVSTLLTERRALVIAVETAVERFIPPDMERMFAPPSRRNKPAAEGTAG